jgi:hypothetical protein
VVACPIASHCEGLISQMQTTIEQIITDFSYEELAAAICRDLPTFYCLLSYIDANDDEAY